MKHHEQTLAAFVDVARKREEVFGVIVVGSVARRTERPDSDVDVYLVVDEDEFARSRTSDRLSYVDQEIATYPGGYVDVKVISGRWLEAAVAHADEPTRASLRTARIAWSVHPDLQNQLDAITAPPDEDWWGRQVETYTAQFRLYGGYFLPQGVAHGDPFLAHWAAGQFVLATGRALLADAHVLFAGPKYLRRSLEALPKVPDSVLVACDRLLIHPDPALVIDIMMTTEQLLTPSLATERTLGRFVAEVELSWLWSAPLPPRSPAHPRGRRHGDR